MPWDTWLGDAHANYYKESVYLDLHNYHRRYESFSTMLRMTFDQAPAARPPTPP